MKTNFALLLILMLVMLNACKKEKFKDSIPVPVIAKAAEFDTCNCAAAYENG